MALQRLHRPDEARAALRQADAMYQDLEVRLANSPSGPLGGDWVDVLIFQIVRREAGTVVPPPGPEEPR